MDHAEALEQIEIAAAEPDGLDRLMAGDTPDAAAVAGHLAGCPACARELEAYRRTAALVREVVAEEPDPALRGRTLAFVREFGRDRSGAAGVDVSADAGMPIGVEQPAAIAAAAADVAASLPAAVVPAAVVPIRRRRLPLIAAIGMAAALLLAGVVGYGAAGGFAPAVNEEPGEVAVLQDATLAMARIAGAPDARQVAMTSTNGGAATGSLLFSPSSGELVMIASGLPAAAAGAEYNCWVEVDGQRRRLGELYPGGEVQAWSGIAAGVDNLPAGSVFGVTLVSPSGTATQVMTGSL